LTSYHQTGHVLTQAQLADFETRAETQEAKVLEYVRRMPLFTVEDLEERAVLPLGTPHSSYIRAVANLRKQGRIRKCGQTRGRYDRPINIYERCDVV
jgi:hypothetical protein